MEDLLKCQINPLVKYRQNQIYTHEPSESEWNLIILQYYFSILFVWRGV